MEILITKHSLPLCRLKDQNEKNKNKNSPTENIPNMQKTLSEKAFIEDHFEIQN